jgi:hypothetical protein
MGMLFADRELKQRLQHLHGYAGSAIDRATSSGNSMYEEVDAGASRLS